MLYWQNEYTGRMKEIVMKYFNNTLLNPEELDILKAYIIQWVNGCPAKPGNYTYIITHMNQSQLRKYVVEVLLPYGIDPF